MRIELSTLKGMKQGMESFSTRTSGAECDVSDPNHDKDFRLVFGYHKEHYAMVLHAPNGRKLVEYVHADLEECESMFFGMIANECDVGGDPRFPMPESALDTIVHVISHTTGLADGEEKIVPIMENLVMHYIYDEGEYQFMLYGNLICVSTSIDLEVAKDAFIRKLEFITYGDTDPAGVYAGLGAALDNLLEGGE